MNLNYYQTGDWVVCTTITQENHEGLGLYKAYEVVGATLLDGNLVYTLKDAYGKLHYSVDRFVTMREYLHKDTVEFDDFWEEFNQCVEDNEEIKKLEDVKVTKYKVGDLVRVRDDLEIDGTYKMESGKQDSFVLEMEEFLGGVVEITAINDFGEYDVAETDMCFTDEMFVGVVEDVDDEDEIDDDFWLDIADEDDWELAVEGEDDWKWVVEVEDTDNIDMVNHPPHYKHGGIETLEVIKMCLTKKEFIGYLKGNVLKYRERAPFKGNQEQDYAKAKFYYDRYMEEVSK